MSTDLPNGLYYVDRDDRTAYLLTSEEFPPIVGLERDMLRAQLGSFGLDKAFDAYNAVAKPWLSRHKVPAVEFEPDATFDNMVGGPFGLYYVTLDRQIFQLTGAGYPPLDAADQTTLMGYVKYAMRVAVRDATHP